MSAGVELPPAEFQFGNYGADIPFMVYMDNAKLVAWLTEGREVEGWCRMPAYRPIPGQVAVMVVDFEDNSRRWSHIPEMAFQTLQEKD